MMIVKKNLSFYFGEEERKCQKCDCKEKFIATCFIPGCFSCFHDIEQVIAHFERSGSYLEHRLYDPTKEISFEDLHEILSLTIKEDKVTKLIIFSNCLLAQTESDQFTIINTGGSAKGKRGTLYRLLNCSQKMSLSQLAMLLPLVFTTNTEFSWKKGTTRKRGRKHMSRLEKSSSNSKPKLQN